MKRRPSTIWALSALSLFLPLALLSATQLRSPYLARVRPLALVALAGMGGFLLLAAVRRFRTMGSRRGHLDRILATGLGACGLMLIALPAGFERQAQHLRAQVLRAPTGSLERYSRHVILGYRSFDEIASVLAHMELGGIYVTARNVRDRDINAVRAEIDALQAIQRSRGRPPLLVAADQEGGLISRLSPPLPDMPNLAQVIASAPKDRWREAVISYAARKARLLKRIGINVNLSPVVDLKVPGAQRGIDLHSKIAERAIGEDPVRVAVAAELYTLALRSHGVLAVAKHFPGLGHVAQDTHHFAGRLSHSRPSLEQSDWVPFAHLARRRLAAIMVGHVVVEDVDPDNLASSSPILLTGTLRGKYRHRGLVLTDDLCMAPVYYGPGGIGAMAGRSLKAGADLLLITYEPGYLYPVLAHLIQSSPGRLERGQRRQSRNRIAELRRWLFNPRRQPSAGPPLADGPEQPRIDP